MNLEKQKAFIIHVIFIVFLLSLVYVGIKYLLPLLMPFVIGMVIAVAFRRPIDFIKKKTKFNRVLISITMLIVFYGLIVYFTSLIGFKTFNFLRDFIVTLPSFYKDTLLPAFRSLLDDLMKNYPSIRPYVEDFMNNINQSIFDFLSNASTSIFAMLTGLASQVPSLLIKLIFTIVSSFFFTIDYYKLTRFIILQFKGEKREMLLRLKDNGVGTIGKFFRAYSAIISITFLELSVGFWIIGIPHPIIFGLLIAIIDVLPILGTGAVILPWSIISFILGNTRVGIGMLILYIFITAVRQTIEPKIVGQQIGLHPIVTLILMFIGAQLMGVLGLFLLPIIATLLIKLNDEGTIHIFKK